MFSSGYTLIEMLVALAILLILLALGLPMTSYYVANTHADTIITRLHTTLQFTRAEAIKRNAVVILCPSADQRHCGGEWESGMLVFVDTQGTHQVNTDTDILRIQELIPNGKLSWHGFGAQHYIEFTPYGLSNQQNGTFVYCIQSNDMPQTRGIIVNKSGRARFAARTPQGGIINASGDVIVCQ